MDLMLLISIAHALVNNVSVKNVNKMNLLLPYINCTCTRK